MLGWFTESGQYRWGWIFRPFSRRNRSFRYSNISVRSTVVEQITLPLPDHPFSEHNVRDLSNFLPFLFGSENWNIGAREEDSRIFPIEDRHSSTIYEFVVGAVVDKNNSFRGNDRRWPRFSNARVKLSRTHW